MIEWDICSRGEGKTTRMIEWVNNDPENRIMVVANQSQISYLFATGQIDKRFLYTMAELQQCPPSLARPNLLIGIDELGIEHPHLHIGRISATGVVVRSGPTEADLMMARNGLQRLAQR